MRETTNILSMMEALETTTEEVAHEIARANTRLAGIRTQQRHFEALVVHQHAVLSSKESV